MLDINKCYDCFSTEPDSAYFWSGLGENGQDIASQIAQENNGTTLEMLMEKNKDTLISAGFPYDEDLGGFYFTKDNAQDWQLISQAYAEQASGNVHAVLGDQVRENSVWNSKEFPALKENSDVDKVISVDPSTRKEKDILLDKNSSETSTTTHSNTTSQNVAATTGGGYHAPPITAADTAQESPKGKVDTNTTDGFYNAKVSPTNNSSDVTQGINKTNTGFNM